MEGPISARYLWDPECLVEAWAAHRRHQLRPVFIPLLVLMAGVAVLGSLSIPFSMMMESRLPPEIRRNGLIAFVAIGMFWGFVIYGGRTRLFLRWNARSAFRSLPGGPQFVEWSIDPAGLSNRTTNSASTLLWSAFLKVVEDREGFPLYQSARFFNWIPGHAFASEAELGRFRDLARARAANYVVRGECRFVGKPESVDPDGF